MAKLYVITIWPSHMHCWLHRTWTQLGLLACIGGCCNGRDGGGAAYSKKILVWLARVAGSGAAWLVLVAKRGVAWRAVVPGMGSSALLDLLACTDGCDVPDHIWLHAFLQHLLTELQCPVPLVGLFACTGACVVSDHVWVKAFLQHIRKKLHRLVRPRGLVTCTDGCDVRDHVWT